MWIGIAVIIAVLGLFICGVIHKGKFGHWARITVSILSGCFIFPHALTENDEVARRGGDKNAKVREH